MQLRKQFNKNISTFVGYTHTIVDATAQRAANVDGYVPKGAWNIGVDYDEGKFSASLLGKGIIDRPGPQTADAVDNFFPATTYWVWDLGLNYKVSKTIKAYVKVNNILINSMQNIRMLDITGAVIQMSSGGVLRDVIS